MPQRKVSDNHNPTRHRYSGAHNTPQEARHTPQEATSALDPTGGMSPLSPGYCPCGIARHMSGTHPVSLQPGKSGPTQPTQQGRSRPPTCVAARNMSSSAFLKVPASWGLASGASSSASMATSSRNVTHVTRLGTCRSTHNNSSSGTGKTGMWAQELGSKLSWLQLCGCQSHPWNQKCSAGL